MSVNYKLLPILIIALLVGLIFCLPHMIIPYLLKSFRRYNPFIIDPHKAQISYEETYTYLPTARELLEGKLPRDSYLFEYKNEPSPFIGDIFPAIIMASLARLFGSIGAAFTFADFLFPFLIFLILYFLVYQVTRDGLISITTGITILFVPEFFAAIPYPKALWKYFFNFSNNQFLFFSRNFNPQLSFLILITTWYFFFKTKNSNRQSFTLLSGLFLGLLFYTYLFYWTFSWFSMFFLLIYFFVKKDYKNFKKFAVSCCLGILIGIFYLVNFYKFKTSPYYEALFTKSSSFVRQEIYLSSLRYILLALMTGLFVKRRRGFILWGLLFFGSFLPILGQLILKRNFEFDHFFYRLMMPLGTINLFILIYFLKKRFNLKRLVNLSLTLLLVLLFISAILRQSIVAKRNYQIYVKDEAKEELFAWLNKNTEEDSVIASLDYDVILVIPAFTHNNTYVPMGNRSLASMEESFERYLQIASFLKLDKKNLGSLFNPKDTFLEEYFKDRLTPLEGIAWFASFNWQKSLEFYPKLNEKQGEELFRYRIDYIVIGPLEKKLKKVDLNSHKSVDRVFENGDYSIYKVL